MLEDKFRQPLSPGYAVFLYECRIGREHDTIFDPSPNMNRHGTTTTIEETEMRASAIAMLPGATTSTVTESVQWPGGFAASVITSTDRIMGSIVRPLPPAGGHVYVYWDTVMWEYETRTTTAPDYGTLTEEIIWTVVHREVHMTPGYQVAGGLVYRRLHPTATTCWSQTVYSEAGKSYHEGKEAALDRPLDKWLKRKMRRNPQCGKKHKRGRGKVMVKRKRKAAMKFVKQARGKGERKEATVTDGGEGKEAATHVDLLALLSATFLGAVGSVWHVLWHNFLFYCMPL